jgi:hypothetical protein
MHWALMFRRTASNRCHSTPQAKNLIKACRKTGRQVSLRGAVDDKAISFPDKDCFASLAMTHTEVADTLYADETLRCAQGDNPFRTVERKFVVGHFSCQQTNKEKRYEHA